MAAIVGLRTAVAEAITAASTDDKEKKFGNVFTLISEMPGHKVADRRESLTVLPFTMVPRGYKDSQKVLSFPGLASGQKKRSLPGTSRWRP